MTTPAPLRCHVLRPYLALEAFATQAKFNGEFIVDVAIIYPFSQVLLFVIGEEGAELGQRSMCQRRKSGSGLQNVRRVGRTSPAISRW